jgi:hypothetical protein
MGAWGSAIFSDDLASDLRDEFKDLIAEGLNSEEATEKLIESYGINKDDLEEYNVFWLSLAATQWKIGRLNEEVKIKAIEIIDNGSDLERWYEEGEPGWAKQREKHLLKLKDQLLSPQPEPKKVKKRYKSQTDLNFGDAISYRLNSGNYVIFRVIGHHTDDGGTDPVCEICDWFGKDIPQPQEIEKLKVIKEKVEDTIFNRKYSKIILGQLSKKDYPNPRTTIVAKGLNIKSNNEAGGGWVFLWKSLDKQLLEHYGIS